MALSVCHTALIGYETDSFLAYASQYSGFKIIMTLFCVRNYFTVTMGKAGGLRRPINIVCATHPVTLTLPLTLHLIAGESGIYLQK